MTDETTTTETSTETSTTTDVAADTAGASTENTETTTTEADGDIDLSKASAEDKGDDKGDDKDDDKGDDEVSLHGAPAEGEAYDFSDLEMPEGVELDTEALTAIDPVLRELDLSKAGASKLISTYANDVIPRVQQQVLASIETQVADNRADWTNQSKALIAGKDAEGKPIEPLMSAAGDELTFDGKTLKEVQQVAARALDKLTSPAFREALDQTGFGVNPGMLMLAYQAGKTLSEDRSFETSTSEATPKTRTQKYYGR